MANIFSLYGSIFIDNEKANKSIDDTTGKAENSGSKVGGAFKSIAKGAAVMGTAVVGAATTLGTAAFGMASKMADTASAIDDSSKKVGMSAEEYQKWVYAAGQCGMESATLEKAMIKQQKSFADAKDGSKSMSTAYKRLGLDINEFGNSGDAFNAVIAKLSEMKDETTRNALANDIFGKSYAELTPLLAEGAAGIEDLKKEAVDLGGVMSNETVSAGEQLGDTFDKIKFAGSGLFTQLGSSLLPIIQTVCNVIIQNIPMIQSVISQLAPIIAMLFSQLLPPLMDLAQMLFPILIDLIMQILPPCMTIISAILPVITDLLNMLLPPIMEIVKMILPLLLSLIEPLLPLLQPILALLQPLIDLLMMIITPLVELLNMILPPIIKIISKLIEIALKPLKEWFNILAGIIGGSFKAAFDGIKNYANTAINVFKNIIDFIKNVFTGNWKGAWEAVKNIFSSIFDGIKNAFKIPINWIIDGINFFIRGINKIKIPDWVPGVGGKGFNIDEFKKLRIGMEYVPYDDMPALLHKGEQVLTASEAKAYKESLSRTDKKDNSKGRTTNIYVYISKFINNRKQDVQEFTDEVMEIAEEKRRRDEEVFA